MSFTDQQQADLLPDGWDPSRRNIVIFNSSEDEFAAIGDEWRNAIAPSQNDAIRMIVEAGRDRWPDTHFTIRVHPNLRGVDNGDVAALLAMAAPNMTIVPPDSPVGSYGLLDHADAVLTFGSTMGIEATYWGKPSIVAGPSFYMHLDAAYHPRSHDELMDLLGTSLPAKPQTNALVYGSYMHTFGTPYRYWEADGRLDGVFRGLRLSEARARSLQSVPHLLHRWKWSTYRVLRQALDTVGLVPVARCVKYLMFPRSASSRNDRA